MTPPTDHSMATAPGRRRTWWRITWLPPMGVMAAVAGTVIALNLLWSRADECRRGETTVALLRGAVAAVNALEWQAIAKGRLTPEMSGQRNISRSEIRRCFDDLRRLEFQQPQFGDAERHQRVYDEAVDEEFALLAAGRFQEAEQLDEARVDPAFIELDQTLGELSVAYHRSAARTLLLLRWAMALVVCAGAGIIFYGFREYRRKRRRVEVAEIEQRLLRETNRRLEALNQQIGERTRELQQANDKLRVEIAERKRAEVALARLHLQNELILNSAAEGILGLDERGHHTFVNPAAAMMLDYAAAELIGRPGHDLWHHTKADGSQYPREKCLICAAYRDGMTRHVSTEVFWRKDGTSFPVEYTSRPIFEQGRRTGAVVTFTDITERKQAEAQREHLIAELKTALAEVKTLSGIIPICAGCKKIRDDQGFWNQVESYISRHSLAQFSHGLCPDCARRLYPDDVEEEP
jgi:PAS domain S-box-containing protein